MGSPGANAVVGAARQRVSLTLLERLFIAAAVLAPIDMRLVGSFTVYDVMILGLLVGLVLERRAILWLPPRFLAPTLVFLTAAFASLMRSTDLVEGLTQSIQFVFVFAVLMPVICTVAVSQRVVLATMAAFVVGAAFTVVAARVMNVAGGNDRVLTLFNSNPNRLGYPAGYALPFALFGLWELRRRRRPLLLALASAGVAYLTLWAVAASGSRGAAAAMVVAAAVYWLFADGFRLDWTVLRRAVTLTIGALVVVFMLSSWSLLPGTLNERVAATAAGESTLIDDRARLANAAFAAFEDSPWIGTGLDNFRYVAKEYDELSTEQAPHNVFLQFMAQTGVFGVLAFVGLLLIWYHLTMRAHQGCDDPRWRRVIWTFVASLTSVIVILMTTPIMVHRHYWLIFGLGAVAAGLGSTSDQAMIDD